MLADATLKRKYGIDRATFDELMRKQKGVCAICGCHQRYQSLAVDHCHKTGIVRGLLCVQCNRGLGRFFDSPIRLRRAAEYIEASRRPLEQVGLAPSTSPELTGSASAHFPMETTA